MEVHKSMLGVSELIYENLQDVPHHAGQVHLILEVFMARHVIYFGVLRGLGAGDVS